MKPEATLRFWRWYEFPFWALQNPKLQKKLWKVVGPDSEHTTGKKKMNLHLNDLPEIYILFDLLYSTVIYCISRNMYICHVYIFNNISVYHMYASFLSFVSSLLRFIFWPKLQPLISWITPRGSPALRGTPSASATCSIQPTQENNVNTRWIRKACKEVTCFLIILVVLFGAHRPLNKGLCCTDAF